MNWLSDQDIAVLAATGTDAYRLAWRRGVLVERFAAVALISVEHPDDASPALVAEIRERLPAVEAIYVRHLIKNPHKTDAPQLVFGAPQSPRFVVRESGLAYEVDFSVGYSCGLFLDQRENRLCLRNLLIPNCPLGRSPNGQSGLIQKFRRILNTYAFTCAFSVAAAREGAQTLSVDIAKQALVRGRRNFELNGLPLEGHRFYADDTFDVLHRLARRGEKFDAIILDPPTFSRNHAGKIFRVEGDMPALLAASLPCLASEGSILLSTNSRSLDTSALAAIVRRVCGTCAELTFPPRPDSGLGASTTAWLRCR